MELELRATWPVLNTLLAFWVFWTFWTPWNPSQKTQKTQKTKAYGPLAFWPWAEAIE